MVFQTIFDWLITAIGTSGYFGIFILMLIESTIIPLPSELIIIPAGVLVYEKQLSWAGVMLASTLGSIAGALINYFFAYHFGRKLGYKLIDKFGKYIFLSHKHMEKIDNYFKSHGSITTFIGRLIPGTRHLISIPAGFAKMNINKFVIYTGLGSAIWTAILLILGYTIGKNSELITKNLNTIIYITIVFCIVLVLIYILKNKLKPQNTK